MKLLVLGSDPSVLNPASAMAARTKEYGAMTEKYTVLVADKENGSRKLSEQVTAYGLKARGKFLLWLKIYFFATHLLQEEKYDLISSPDAYYLGLVSWLLARRCGAAVQVQVHGWEKHSWWRRALACFVLRRADGIRVVSQRLKNQLVEEFGLPADKIIAIPIFVDFSVKPADRQRREEDGKFVFLTVSRLVEVKNIPLQFSALKQLRKTKPQAELWLVGDGPEKSRLEKLARELMLGEAVKFLGWQNRTEDFYRQADAFVLTSNSEGWGMVVIEAASRGLPIIMTDVGCAGEVIKNEDSGLVVPVKETAPLINAMERLIDDEGLRNRLGQGAAAAVSHLPDLQQTLALYYEGWQKIINKNI